MAAVGRAALTPAELHDSERQLGDLLGHISARCNPCERCSASVAPVEEIPAFVVHLQDDYECRIKPAGACTARQPKLLVPDAPKI
jgi:hypothetical protein